MHDAWAKPVMFYMLYWSGQARYALHVYCSGQARCVLQVTIDLIATVVGRYAARVGGGDDGLVGQAFR